MALLFPGSSAIAATDYSHPQFTVTEERTLNLQAVGSQIVIDTIEDALRAGGLALLGEDFQIDSSLSYVTEESSDGTIKGEIDLVLPFYNKNGHVIFTQPGLVFWEGLAEEERVDANLGMVYRTNLANTPIDIDAIGGASLFYDYDLHRVGHERLGIGLDMQSGDFHSAFNYYYPLSNEEDGREGFVEEALKGMDLRVALEREAIRAGARLGYWRYDGGKDVADEWRTSVGIEGGVRVAPGVFIEAEWEKHQEDVILDQRLSLGLAFRFSLPDFEGQGYKGGSMSSDLHRIVEREKRVLYEEREAVARPSVSIGRTGDETGQVAEGDTIELDILLSEALGEDVTINLVGSGSADYGEDGDWVLDNGSGSNCDSVTGVSCQVTITAGQTNANGVEIAIRDDGNAGEDSEDIILSMAVASAGNTGLMSDGSLVLNIEADPVLPEVSLSATSTEITEGGTATLTLALSGTAEADATFNLVGVGGTAEVTYGASNDWSLSVGGTGCDTATEDSPCKVTIPRGETTAEVTVEVNADMDNESSSETFTVSVEVDSGSAGIVQEGNPSSLTFTIPANGNTVSIDSSMSDSTVGEDGGTASVVVKVDKPASTDITLNVSAATSSTAKSGNYTITGDNYANGALTIAAGDSSGTVTVTGVDNETTETTARTIVLNFTGTLPAGWGFDPSAPLTHTITITDDDTVTTPPGGTVTFSNPTLSTIAEIGGSTIITATISPQLPADETVTVAVTPSGTAVQDTDYELSVSGGTLAGNMWTLPTQASGARLTVATKENPGITNDISFTLAFSGATSTGGWSITAASHDFTIDNGAIAKNRIGFAVAGGTITVDEDVRTTPLTMQLSNKDGTPYTGRTVSLHMQASVAGATNSNDYQVGFDVVSAVPQALWVNTGSSAGNIIIFSGVNHNQGLIALTITVTDDMIDEGTGETFTISIAERRAFPAGWEIDPNNDSFTLTINDND